MVYCVPVIGNLFLCFPVPEASVAEVQRVGRTVALPPGWRLVDHSEWHLTLVFLGPHDPSGFAHVLDGLTPPAVPLQFSGWSFFPHPGAARVLALSGPTPVGLASMVEELNRRAAAAGWQSLYAKPFVLHLTVARGPLASAWDVPAFDPLTLTPERVELWQTEGLNPARYRVVTAVPCVAQSSGSPSTT